ncbi:MAG: flagellar basal body rod C-terminal domain-containing protein [Micavibrio sp.]
MMIGAISTALSGIVSATKKADGAAHNIANAATPGREVNLAQEAVDLKIAEIAFKANVKILEAADEMAKETGRLFDKKV